MSTTYEQFGRYQFIQRIAIGGMGEVFLARYVTAAGIERHAVVKRILPHLSSDPDFVSYFLREGRIASLLCHPNIVQTLELGRTNNQYYIAMEYIPGQTLVQLLATAMRSRRPFSIDLVLHLSGQIAASLEYIHNLSNIEGTPLKIIHMDLAPHNIMVTPQVQAKLVDFGISRASGLIQSPPSRDFRGRTAYLAPEQIDGLSLDQRTDLFALGIIMHEMILCRPLFRVRSDHQTATRILHAPIPRPHRERAECPDLLDKIVLKALARDREQRYQNAGQILQDLDACAQACGSVRPLTVLRAELDLLRKGMVSRAVELEETPAAELAVSRPGQSEK